MNEALKEVLEFGLVASGSDVLGRAWNRGRTIVLAYHNIVPHGEEITGDRSLHLRQEEFSRHLDLLSESHNVVSLSSLESPRPSGEHGLQPMRAAITFDDAYRGALTAGLDEVRRRGLPATVFVSPGLLGEEGFWWDLLSSEETGNVDDAVREHALTRLEGDQSRILRWARSEGHSVTRHLPDHARPGTVGMLRSASRRDGITLGIHGWRHLDLSHANDEALARELGEPAEWLADHDLPCQRWLAYPYGRHSERAVRRASERHTLAFTTAGRLLPRRREDLDRMRIPRVNIPAGAGLRGFRLRTSGVLP